MKQLQQLTHKTNFSAHNIMSNIMRSEIVVPNADMPTHLAHNGQYTYLIDKDQRVNSDDGAC